MRLGEAFMLLFMCCFDVVCCVVLSFDRTRFTQEDWDVI